MKENISKAKTTIARLQNLLEERGISIPPSISEEIDSQLSSYKDYLEFGRDIEIEQLEKDSNTLEAAFEILRKNYDGEVPVEVRRAFSNAQDRINEQIQNLTETDIENMLADPNRL